MLALLEMIAHSISPQMARKTQNMMLLTLEFTYDSFCAFTARNPRGDPRPSLAKPLFRRVSAA
jgi:hypothetical protein